MPSSKRARSPLSYGHLDLSFKNTLLETVRDDVRELSERFDGLRIHRADEFHALENSKVECSGDRRMKDMEYALNYLEENGYRRSRQQRVMHEGFLTSSISSYYGVDLDRNLSRLLRERELETLKSECMVLAPRRFGKSISLAMFAACELLTQPGHEVLVYSNNHRASKAMLLTTFKMIRILQTCERFKGIKILSLNKNCSITVLADGHENTLYAYPAKRENLRGTGCQTPTGTVILEEMAFIPKELVMEIVAPTLTRRGIKLIGITTVNGPDSFIGPMADSKLRDGTPVFLTLNFELVCAECKRRGTRDTCRCLDGDIPHWHTSSNHEKVEAMMGAEKDLFNQEIRGMMGDGGGTPAFARQDVAFLLSRESVYTSVQMYATEFFTVVDPSGNGANSNFAIISAVFKDDQMVIVGIDAIAKVDSGAHGKLIAEHIARVRTISGMSDAISIFCPENNMSHEGDRLSRLLLAECCPRTFVIEEKRGVKGALTDNPSKKRMWYLAKTALSMRRVKFHPACTCGVETSHTDINGLREMLVAELGRYKRKLKYNKNSPDRPPTEIFSGKDGGATDDLAIVFQLLYNCKPMYDANRNYYANERGFLYNPPQVTTQSSLFSARF